jgi:hypothetical protein
MLVKFPYSASRRVAARRPRRSKNGTPEERAARAAAKSGPPAPVTEIPPFRCGDQRGPAAPVPEFAGPTVASMTDAELAAMEFAPWPHDPRPGPSHEQWEKWNNIHGATLRIVGALMQQDKKSLVDYCTGLDDREWKDLNAMFDQSGKFFSDMANLIEGARYRLVVATAVAAQQEAVS